MNEILEVTSDDFKNIDKVTADIIDTLKSYLDIKESLGIDNGMEILGDLNTGFRVLKNMNDLRWKSHFKSFVKGFNIEEELPEKKLEKLKKYIDDENKAYFISDLLSKILFSKSKKSCIIIGYILNHLTENNSDLLPQYIVCADALTDLFDHDIDNLKFINLYMNNEVDGIHENKKKSKYISYGKKLKEVLNYNKIDNTGMILSMEKLSSKQILFKEYDITSELDVEMESVDVDSQEYYTLSKVGEMICEYIRKLEL